MHLPPLLITSLVFVVFLASFPGLHAWTCDSSCGGIALSYPFGSAQGCGSSAFQNYVNCSDGKLRFYTPTGIYRVQSIDYNSNVIIVEDPRMSTCSKMQASEGFGLPIGSPFSFASYNQVVLIGCSSTSSLYSTQSCDASSNAQEICQSLYGNCAGVSQEGTVATSSSSINGDSINGSSSSINGGAAASCCVYSSSLLSTAPYEVDLPLLQCSSYTSVYRMGSVQSPQSSWLYGIALLYNPSEQAPSPPSGGGVGQNPSCYVCQEAEGNVGAPAAVSSFAGAALLVIIAIIAQL